jgi:sortase B
MKKRKIIALICLGLGLACGAIGIYKYIEEKNAGKEYEKLQQEVVKEEPKPVEEPEPEPESTVEIPIDFAALQQQNPDVYAWIQVPGTEVDYPILQSSNDNTYYLNHTIDGEEKKEGAIFTENYNTKTFEDPNTVIYGHDMKNGSMFQSIHKYMDRSFFDNNRDIVIYMPDQILSYKIFAAYLTDNKHLLMNYNFWSKDEYQQYLNSIFSMRDMNAFIDTSTEVTNEDKIITLSTCYAGISTQRYLVQAVLVSIEK